MTATFEKRYVVDCISHKVKKNDDRPQYYVENSHPAIVTKEMFNRVQEEMARRNNKRKVKQVGTKTDSGKYSSKFALTELLICGCCGTPYRRCTWSKNGKKRIVWRCISRLDYGKKYCQESPTVDEPALQKAIVTAICAIASDNSTIDAITALKLHAQIFFGGENSTATDELRVKELVARITKAAGSGSYTDEMAALVKELNEVKQRIATHEQQKKANGIMEHRLAEVTEAINGLKETDIRYSDDMVRRLIDCVRVLSAEEIEVTFKGGAKRKALLNPA